MNKPQKQTVYLPTKVEDAEKYSKHTIKCEKCEGLTVIEQYTCSHCWCEGGDGELGFDDIFAKKEGYFFTPEQLNEYTQSVIKQALETAAEKMYETFHTICEDGSTKGVFKTQKEALDFANILNNKTNLYHDWVKVTRLNGGMDKKSITNTFENTFEKFKV